jgi:peptidoglycan/xylan/chitin deacetylase (PgdA/CDA1 family)
VTRVPGLKTIRRRGLQLAARWRPSALVLGYHRVTEDGRDPFGLAVSKAHFEGHMEQLARRGVASRLAAVVGALSDGRPAEGGVAITFDDGYVDNLEIARPVLDRLGLPYTVFVTTGRLGRRFWWHRLADLVRSLAATEERLEFESGGRAWAIETRGGGPGRRSGLSDAYRVLAGLGADEREHILDDLGPRSEDPGGPPERAMTADELRVLASGDRAELGAHGVTHAPLDGLDERSARSEIRESGTALARLTGRPVRHFSYPHGRTSAGVRSLVREAGYEAACASEPSPVFRGRDPFGLPRVWVPDVDGREFDRWLSGWTGD